VREEVRYVCIHSVNERQNPPPTNILIFTGNFMLYQIIQTSIVFSIEIKHEILPGFTSPGMVRVNDSVRGAKEACDWPISCCRLMIYALRLRTESLKLILNK